MWNEYPTYPCGPVTLTGNIATFIAPYISGYWDGGGCAPVTCDGTNTNV